MNDNRQVTHNKEKSIISGYVYLMRASNGYYKIGKTKNLVHRNNELLRQFPLRIKIIHSFFAPDNTLVESDLHRMFKDKRLQGDWFALNKEDIGFIKRITDITVQTLFESRKHKTERELLSSVK
jgi:hypothetical protein